MAAIAGEADAFADETMEESLDSAGTYLKDAVEYLEESPNNSAGIHVLLSSLAELTTQRAEPSQWIRNFVQTITSKLPECPNVSEYIEAYLFPSHFPVRDPITGRPAGCMPLHMYSTKTVEKGMKDFVHY